MARHCIKFSGKKHHRKSKKHCKYGFRKGTKKCRKHPKRR